MTKNLSLDFNVRSASWMRMQFIVRFAAIAHEIIERIRSSIQSFWPEFLRAGSKSRERIAHSISTIAKRHDRHRRHRCRDAS